MKKLVLLVIVWCLVFGSITTAFASDDAEAPPETPYTVEIEDPMLDGATLLSEETTIENDRMITETVYCTKDGLIVTDTLDQSAVAAHSKNGTDTVTRRREMGSFGTISLTATFQLYTDEDAGVMGSGYVRCKSMSASKTIPSGYTCDVWEKDYEDTYQSFGTAWAQVKYKIYENKDPANEVKGTFKITCDDTGKISDNG